MITNPADYAAKYEEIINTSSPVIKMINESTEPKFIIDSDARIIQIPSVLSAVGALNDHNAETIYFQIPRYFDTVDLQTKSCVIQGINAIGEGFVGPGMKYIKEEDPDNLLIGWTITNEVTKAAGYISLSLRFFSKTTNDEGEAIFDYSFNTKTISLEVYDSLDIKQGELNVDYPLDTLSATLDRIEKIIEGGGAGGGTGNYVDLTNKPKINGVELVGDRTAAQLGLLTKVPDEYLTTDNVDDALSSTSLNPVQNKVINSQITNILNQITLLDTKIEESAYFPIELLAFSNDVNTAEKGTTISTVNFNWEYNKVPTSLTLEGLTITPSEVNTSLTNLSITADRIFTLTATDEKGQTSTLTTNIKFLDSVYYGAAAEPAEYNNEFISAFTKKLQETKAMEFTVNAADDQYIYLCAPAAFGDLLLGVNGFIGGFSKVITLDFESVSGYTSQYSIYKSDFSGLGMTTVQVK